VVSVVLMIWKRNASTERLSTLLWTKMTPDTGWYLTKTRRRMLRSTLHVNPQIEIVGPVATEGVEAPGEMMIDTVVVLIVAVPAEIHGETETENEVTVMIGDTRIYPVKSRCTIIFKQGIHDYSSITPIDDITYCI
jgi:hypothetical protein